MSFSFFPPIWLVDQDVSNVLQKFLSPPFLVDIPRLPGGSIFPPGNQLFLPRLLTDAIIYVKKISVKYFLPAYTKKIGSDKLQKFACQRLFAAQIRTTS